jgi:nicotinamidase-related amidase
MRKYSNCLLDPSDVAALIIDHEPQMYFGIESSSRAKILNGVVGLVKATRIFNVPCVLSTVEAQTFSGPLLSKIQQVCPDVQPIDRTTINSWEDENIKKAVKNTKKNKILISGLWTEACVAFPALSLVSEGFDVYVVADACGGASKEAHNMAMHRMIQAGVVPVTWEQVLLEFQRDWSNKETYDAVMQIIQEHGGAYGIGVEYANSMIPQPSYAQ